MGPITWRQVWCEAHLLEEVLAHVGVHRGQGVVQEEGVPLAVHRPGHAQPLLLPSREVDASLTCTTDATRCLLLTYLREVARRQHSKVTVQGTGTHNPRNFSKSKNTDLLYSLELEAFPKIMLFFTVAFCTQACCGT